MRHSPLFLLVIAALACPSEDASSPHDAAVDAARPVDSGPERDASASDPDAAAAGGCSLGPGPGCTCVREPIDQANACWHSFGGRYAAGGCSASYQCCDGRWAAGGGRCGACACVDETGAQGCVPEAEGLEVCFPSFAPRAEPLPDAVQVRMIGSSYHDGCPAGFDDLSLLHIPTWGLDGAVHEGELVVATEVAAEVTEAFRRIYEARFPIRRMVLVDEYDGRDDLSMADDNTSAFNCRFVEGTDIPSEHSFGTAIDINPLENPYIRGKAILPPESARYTDRNLGEAGMIVTPGPVTAAFAAIGWGWGGSWDGLKDYQHFSQSGN